MDHNDTCCVTPLTSETNIASDKPLPADLFDIATKPGIRKAKNLSRLAINPRRDTVDVVLAKRHRRRLSQSGPVGACGVSPERGSPAPGRPMRGRPQRRGPQVEEGSTSGTWALPTEAF
jgi:hypothetical protein